MAESNYDILKIQSGASKKDIRKAYRSLVLKLHSDRGGDDEQFKKIKRAYEDLRLGKKYPETIEDFSSADQHRNHQNRILPSPFFKQCYQGIFYQSVNPHMLAEFF